MTTFSAPRDQQNTNLVFAVLYSILVPILVVLFQSAYVVNTGWSFRYNALLASFGQPVVIIGMGVLALVSFAIMLPFANKPNTRWFAFLICVVAFSAVAILLAPRVAE